MRYTVCALSIAALISCRAQPALTAPARLFGPVIENETIAGRADDEKDDDEVVLLIAERDIVTIDLARKSFVRRPLALADGSTCWGLAHLHDGSLWTVCDWRRLRRVDRDGRLGAEFTLDGAQAALFGGGDRLLFQRAQFTAPDQALVAGRPDDPRREPWSTLQTRAFKLARTSVAALNLVTCGNTRADERACWFPDEPAVALIDRSGRTRRLELAGLPRVAPEVLLTSENPPRPVRDAYVDRSGSLWVISAGTAPRGAAQHPGGWLLAHFGPTGTPLQRYPLAEPARLILRADARHVVLLLGSGYIAEVGL